MKLSHLRVQNYRGLRDVSIPLSSFVCITGENNAGKSSVLQALSLFLSGSSLKSTDYFDEEHEILIEVEVSEITESDILLLAEEHRERIQSITVGGKMTLVRRYGFDGKSQLGLYTMVPTEARFSSEEIATLVAGKRGATAIKEAVLQVFPELADQAEELTTQGKAKELIEQVADGLPADQKELQFRPLPTGLDKSIIPMLPERIYIPAVKDFGDETKTTESSSFGKILSIVMKSIEPLLAQEADLFDRLSKKLTRVIAPDGQILDDRLPLIKTIEQTIQRYVQESFSNVCLEIEIPPPELKTVLSTARILADDGVRGPLDLKGDGLRRAVVFSILRSYVELARSTQEDGVPAVEQAERGYLLLFEEPELFLHPEAQKILFDALGVFSEQHQVVVTSHSPLFLSPKALATFIRLAKTKADGISKPFTRSLHVDLTGVKPRDEFQIICYENNNAAFFSRRVVLVEGDSDFIAFPHIAETLNPAWNGRIHSVAFVRVGGKGSISRYKDFFALFESPIFVIADLDTLIDGFEKLDPSDDAKAIRTDLLQAVDAAIDAAGETPTPKADDIKRAQAQTSVRELWKKVQEAKQAFDADSAKFDDLNSTVREFFLWERKSQRQDCLTQAACPEVKRLKLALIWELRKTGTFILERGALDDYYPADVSGGNSDKPKKAQEFIAAYDTREKVLELSPEQTCPDSGRVATEFEFIFAKVFNTDLPGV